VDAVADELKRHIKQLDKLLVPCGVDTEVLVAMHAVTTNRIFTNGKDSNGADIGKYSKAYLKFRQGKGASGSKVILQSPSQPQMIHDFSVICGASGKGLGFKNNINFKKSFWVEETYNKDIFQHTPAEVKQVLREYNKVVKRTLRG